MKEVELGQVSRMRDLTTQQLQNAFADFLRLDIASGDVAGDTIKTYLSQIKQYLAWCFNQDLNPARAKNSRHGEIFRSLFP